MGDRARRDVARESASNRVGRGTVAAAAGIAGLPAARSGIIPAATRAAASRIAGLSNRFLAHFLAYRLLNSVG